MHLVIKSISGIVCGLALLVWVPVAFGQTFDPPPSDVTAAQCNASSECSGAKLCFQHRCVSRKEIRCQADWPCPPTYWRMYWYLDKLCADAFSPKMMKYLTDGRYKGESTLKDLVYLFNFWGAMWGYPFKSQNLTRFYYGPNAAKWLPHTCTRNVKRYASGKQVPRSMRKWHLAIRSLWKTTKRLNR